MVQLHELIDIFCIGEHDTQLKCLNWIKRLKLHEIMNINSKLYNNYALVCFITKLGDLDSLVIHLMIRNHLGLSRSNIMEYSDDVEYLSTIVLNDRARCEALYDWNNVYNGKNFIHDMYKNKPNINGNTDVTDLEYRPPPDFNNEILINSNLNNIQETQKRELILDNYNFYEFYYINFDDNMYTRPYINTYTPVLNHFMLEDLTNVYSGLWFNENDVRWQYSLRSAVLHNVNFDLNILNYSYKCFELVNTRRYYINGQTYSNNAITEKANETLQFECDICRTKLDKYSFSNINIGDLCLDCYYNKKLQFKLRMVHLKNVMLIPGRRVIFKKMCEQTREFLENYQIKKMDPEKKYKLTKNVIGEIQKYNTSEEGNFMECPICLDNMCKKNILFGSCGHCFHRDCILSMGTNKCPVCRKVTEFNKLFVN